ncbi:hypothetical protein HOLleu_43669 [Holothuria leucospilota]|uniref:Uncharacterized protein n=1 Tax=Holothuria leucospilota TaxID=206669 RepID=A0A9Q0YBC4_HOLLE|nr:hypothetical protein HOLleu_43669 [Holothuria leucospilota]
MKVYLKKDVTPYMHVLQCHVGETLRLHGNLSNFSQQGLEKLNDKVTTWYFRSTHHKGNEALRQIMLKENRLQHLKLNCPRSKKIEIKCGVCKHGGHNKRTCSHKLIMG